MAIHCKKCTSYIIPKLAKDFWKHTQNQIRLQCNKMWSPDSDHVGLTHQPFWNSDFVRALNPWQEGLFSFKWLEIDGFKVLKWKNRVISHQKVNITRRPTFMEVQTAFSPPHQLFKSKRRTKSEEKTHIFAYRWAPMYHDEYGLWFAIWIFFWAIKLNSTAISIFFRKLRRQCCLNQVWELTTHA